MQCKGWPQIPIALRVPRIDHVFSFERLADDAAWPILLNERSRAFFNHGQSLSLVLLMWVNASRRRSWPILKNIGSACWSMMRTQTNISGWAGVLGLLRAAGDWRRITLLGSVVAAGILTALWFSALPGPAHAAGMTEGWTKVASGGFTDRNNSYAPATVEFKGYLYLSTVANQAGFIF
jgi:hypothetical protein